MNSYDGRRQGDEHLQVRREGPHEEWPSRHTFSGRLKRRRKDALKGVRTYFRTL